MASDWSERGQKQGEWDGLEKRDSGKSKKKKSGLRHGKRKENVNEAAKMYKEREIDGKGKSWFKTRNTMKNTLPEA